MRSQLEPLLSGLYKVGHCLVLLLDQQGQVLFKSLPRGYQDLQALAPQILQTYVEQIRSVAFPVLLSSTQQVGGIAFFDGTTLVVGPLTKKLQFKREGSDRYPSVATATTTSVATATTTSVATATTNAATTNVTPDTASTLEPEAPLVLASDAEIAAFGDRNETVSELESEEILQLRRNAVNVQLESIAWLAHRLLGTEQTPKDESSIHDLREGGLLENVVLKALSKIKDILPDWREVVPEDRPHNSYVYEFNGLDAIRRGEPQQYLLTQNMRGNGQNGILGYTPLRAAQNISICGVVLNSRAAVVGGLPVEQAYTLADFLILTIERCKTVKQAEYVGLQSGLIFAQLVQRLKKQYPQKVMHTLSAQALEVIQRYLYTNVTRQQLAADLKVNPDYLDRVLKADCNRTALGCLRAARIEESKKLLVQTSTPIYEIAALLLFSSSSHFSRVFKELTGYTPQDYRKLQENPISQIFM